MRKAGIIVCLLSILMSMCISRYIPQYSFPSSMVDEEKANTQAMADRGFESYKKYCGGCHGITSRGQSSIPNFTQAQLNKYADAYKMANGSTHAQFKGMRDRDLEDIFIFLEFRIKK
mgnify:CR=1 FL=1